MAVYNPSLQDFYDLSAADREILNAITSQCAELEMPEPLEDFDHWLDRLARQKQIELLAPTERNARVIAMANRSGKPVVQRTAEPEAAPAARPRTVGEYLAQTGETRQQAHDRVVQRFGPPGQAKYEQDTPRTLPGTVVK